MDMVVPMTAELLTLSQLQPGKLYRCTKLNNISMPSKASVFDTVVCGPNTKQFFQENWIDGLANRQELVPEYCDMSGGQITFLFMKLTAPDKFEALMDDKVKSFFVELPRLPIFEELRTP